MIQSLTIRNIALIEELEIRFHDGMQALSGETGAGKSIVVDAVNLVLGGRADRTLIRSGSDKASVEALFTVRNGERVARLLAREQIDFDGANVTVYREISLAGRNVCRVGGVMVPVGVLRELATELMDIHGQNDHQFLTAPELQMRFLDQIGGEEHARRMDQVREDFGAFLAQHRAYVKLKKLAPTRESRMRELEKELKILRQASFRGDEEETLHAEYRQLQDAQNTADALRQCSEALSGGEEPMLGRIQQVARQLQTAARKDDRLEALSARCESARYEMEDIAFELSRFVAEAEQDPARLNRVEEKLRQIDLLKRRYHKELPEIVRMEDDLEEEYATLDGLEEKLARMAEEHRRLLAAYRKSARALTESRQALAEDFARQMMRELGELGMGATVFEARFAPADGGKMPTPTANGDDRMEFMISPNPGEPLKPLGKIASGGELSRLMLAIKVIEAGRSGVEAMVFDEIDTGISGRMAQVVAEKMVAISRARQVICVTHLPQIAAAADYQYLVQKSVVGERTHTRVTELTPEERAQEIGRMISGADGITPQAAEYARDMLRAGAQRKKR